MTKADLIDEVSFAGKIPRNESEIIVEAIFARIARSVISGKTIEIRGFGSFGLRQHHARVIPNPRKTRAWVAVPAKRIPYFEPSKALRKFVNSSG